MKQDFRAIASPDQIRVLDAFDEHDVASKAYDAALARLDALGDLPSGHPEKQAAWEAVREAMKASTQAALKML